MTDCWADGQTALNYLVPDIPDVTCDIDDEQPHWDPLSW